MAALTALGREGEAAAAEASTASATCAASGKRPRRSKCRTARRAVSPSTESVAFGSAPVSSRSLALETRLFP